jgi:hypothetical protein
MSAYIWYIFGLAVICGISSLVFTFIAASHLSKRGTKINYWDVRFHMFKYLNQYRALTIEENGKTGALFYAGLVTISLFAVSLISFIVLILVGR